VLLVVAVLGWGDFLLGWLDRQREITALAGPLLAVGVAALGLAGFLWQWKRAEQERQAAQQACCEAADWCRKAAEQADPTAQYNLGVCYADGKGVPPDYVEAHKWLDLAASQGVVKAKEAMSELERQMTTEQIAEAQRLVREFQPQQAPAPGADR
jgi:hypothetical protein